MRNSAAFAADRRAEQNASYVAQRPEGARPKFFNE